MLISVLVATCVPIDATAETPATFAPPVELTSDGKPFTGILYPSPAFHDVDGDGKDELVIGDLFGALWHCDPTDDDATAFGKRGRLEANGEPLKLNNW